MQIWGFLTILYLYYYFHFWYYKILPCYITFLLCFHSFLTHFLRQKNCYKDKKRAAVKLNTHTKYHPHDNTHDIPHDTYRLQQSLLYVLFQLLISENEDLRQISLNILRLPLHFWKSHHKMPPLPHSYMDSATDSRFQR